MSDDFNFAQWIVDDAIEDACKQYVSCLRCNTIIYTPNTGGGISINRVHACPNCGNKTLGFIYSEKEWPADDFKPEMCKGISLEDTLELPSPIKIEIVEVCR